MITDLIVLLVYITINIIVVSLYKLYLDKDYKRFVRKEKIRMNEYLKQKLINSL